VLYVESGYRLGNFQHLDTKLVFTQFLNITNTFLQTPVWELSKIAKELFYENIFLEYEFLNPEEYILGIDLEETNTGTSKTLQEYLRENVNLLNLKNSELESTLNLLIELLDEHGFLREPLDKISESYQIGKEIILQAVEILKQIGPKGIASRNFSEYYSIFLDDSENEALKKILNDEIVPYETLERIREKLDSIPFSPASGFSAEEYKGYIVPDIIVKRQNSELIVFLNEMFRLKLNPVEPYKELINNNKNILREYEKALEIVRAMSRRNKVLLDVATFVIEYQKRNIIYGKELRPLDLKTVAEKLNLSLSTVSRAIKDKYVLTDKGIFELRSFFVRNVSKGVKISPEKLKELILEITDNGKINMSDSKIAILLEKRGIKVSRRTVNKYRNILGIFKEKKRF
jgi:RNA polymerase sigma-54 factor